MYRILAAPVDDFTGAPSYAARHHAAEYDRIAARCDAYDARPGLSIAKDDEDIHEVWPGFSLRPGLSRAAAVLQVRV